MIRIWCAHCETLLHEGEDWGEVFENCKQCFPKPQVLSVAMVEAE